MTKFEKLKKQVRENYKNSKGKKKDLITLKRDAFKKSLSNTNGFGAQDLKPAYLELYTFLLKKYGSKLIAESASTSSNDFSVKLSTTA